MKLLAITAVKEYEKETIMLFKKAKINAWSKMDMKGFKSDDNENLVSNWFSTSTNSINSILFFTFTDAKRINILLEEVKKYNEDVQSNNPLRAIVLDVEKFV